ncbi:phosphoribosyltransferase [Microbacterium sp. G2-8]|uniref:phosphoribosyltransferase n=1 Tax=Microbacterium sp. G2-8 TaxID=2842454 RepID=UPI001C8A210A|nr:phosphoribosyltransferase family protein [Microbacterium sp. G2-8]
MALFADRADAGRQLAELLTRALDDLGDAIVFGIPRGGIVVAAEVARALDAPLDSAVVRKLGAPMNEEFAIGAIAEGVRVVDSAAARHVGAGPEQVAFVEDMERVELARRRSLFERTSGSLAGHTALVVDDGIATGATAMAACAAVRGRGPDRVVLAVPVAPAGWRPEGVDAYACLFPASEFWAVGSFYDDFTQTTDDEVTGLLVGRG